MAFHNDFGKQAELKAAEFLEGLGYEILHRNYRYRRAEVDIIAFHSGKVIAVEVKARSNRAFGDPSLAVKRGRVRSIVSVMDHYMQHTSRDEEVRFDIIAIVAEDGEWELEHIEDAFNAYYL